MKDISVKILCNSKDINAEINGSFESIFGELYNISLDFLKHKLLHDYKKLFETRNLFVEFHGCGVDDEFYKNVLSSKPFEGSTSYKVKLKAPIKKHKYSDLHHFIYAGVTFVFFIEVPNPI